MRGSCPRSSPTGCNGTVRLLENLEEDRELVLIIISYGPYRFLKIQNIFRLCSMVRPDVNIERAISIAMTTRRHLEFKHLAVRQKRSKKKVTLLHTLKTKWVKLQKVV